MNKVCETVGKHLQITWDLEALFPGESQSKAYSEFVDILEGDIKSWAGELSARHDEVPHSAEWWSNQLTAYQDLLTRLNEAAAFAECLTAQNVDDRQAAQHLSRTQRLRADLEGTLTRLDAIALATKPSAWAELLTHPNIAPVAFPLDERRRQASKRLSPDAERLVGDLAVDGYHGWSNLYHDVAGSLRVAIQEDGVERLLSTEQAVNRLVSEPDPAVRAEAFSAYEDAWASQAELFAAALNHLGGFRLALYRHRGWSILDEPLADNRLQEATLSAMWHAVVAGKDRLRKYLDHKARMFGQEKLHWHDLGAPLGRADTKRDYDAAAAFIMEHLNAFDPELGALAHRAFTERWIEAEDRQGKQAGGFCVGFPGSRTSRIFLTFDGSPRTVATIAHELGHAYHNYALDNVPPLAQEVSAALAETASTFVERVVSDAALAASSNDAERLFLLDQRLMDAVALLMNIHARFLFELSFYQERRKGIVSSNRLSELMVQAQKEAYGDALGSYHPYFWASKLHFYITTVPFYNFPYTFGYLFSCALYDRAVAEGPSFRTTYAELLRESGRMNSEDLARHYLGVDLAQPDFWQQGVKRALDDVDAFLRLTGEAG